MRLVALLSWYAERDRDLRDMAASLRLAGVDHLVALDGAYGLFPGGGPESPLSNYHALEEGCAQAGIALTAVAPDRVWAGNETEKRTALFRLGEQHTSARDWFLVIDGDEVITACPPDLKQQLEQTPLDVGEVVFMERKGAKLKRFPIPILYRAIRGITVIGNHYTYRTPDGRLLWGNAVNRRLAARLPVHDLVIDHRTRLRDRDRRARARRYYRTRDGLGAERGSCDRCDLPAARVLHANWRPGEGGYVADFTELCAVHALDVEAENRTRLSSFGLDPDAVRVEHRLGPAPAA